jgi:Ca2+-binding RTX toxin-like protein
VAVVPFAVGGSNRDVGKFPHFVTLNMFAETPAGAPDTKALVCRAGLEAFAEVVDGGPRRCVFQRAGLFNGDWLVLLNATLYRVTRGGVMTAFTGSVPGSGIVAIDAGPDADGNSEARIATGDAIYIAKASDNTVAAEAFPDDAGVIDVLFIRGFWIAVREDTQVLYSRVPGDTVWDAITFTSAEYQPDKVVGIERLGDTVLVFGETTLEPFALTGNATNPLAPYGGSGQDVGCKSRDTIVNLGEAVFCITDDNTLSRFGPDRQIVSDHSLSEEIRKSSSMDLRAWGFKQDQHAFYVLSLGEKTWIYDDATKLLATANSTGYDYWRADLGAQGNGMILAADALPNSGRLWRVNPEKLTDDGDDIECVATAFLAVPEGSVICANLVLECARGEAPLTWD